LRERGNRLLKLLDKYAGIPLVAALGAFRKKRLFDERSLQSHDPRFLLLKTAAIGDTVLLSAMVREIKHRCPGASITLVASKGNFPMAAMLNGIDTVVTFDMSAPFRSLKAIAKLKKSDFLLDFAPWARINSLIAYVADADVKVGFKRKHAYRHYVFDIAVEHSDDMHELDNYRNLLRHIQLAPEGYLPALVVEKSALKRVEPLLGAGRPNVVFHPFPGGYRKHLKEWPLDNWIEAGRQLIRGGCRIFISGGRDDVEAAAGIKQELDRDDDQCMVLCGNFSLAETAAILYKSSLLITVNTGIMHMGAALGVDMIALHGPTSPLRWGPVGNKAVVLKPKADCAPCISLGYEYGCSRGGCMKTIKIEDVLRQADVILMKAGA